MASYIFLLFIVYYCCTRKHLSSIVALLIILLPFHPTLKRFFEIYSGNSIVPIWRDILIFILFLRVRIKEGNFKYPSGSLFGFIVFYIFAMFLCGYTFDKESSISIIRLTLMAFLLCLIFTNISFNNDDFRIIIRTMVVTLLIMGCTGFIERFLIYFPYHLFMDHFKITQGGGLVFKMPSYMIMNDIPRMCGFAPGPNQFGVTTAFYTSIALFVYFQPFVRRRRILFEVICLSVICLILSFSRAGWFILISSLSLYLYRANNRFARYALGAVFGLIILIVLGYFIMPEVYEVIIASATGEEASAATRQGMLKDAYGILITELWGHGLGSGRIDESTFTESAHMITIYEIGIQGFLLYILFFYHGLRKVKIGKKYPFSSFVYSLCLVSIIMGFVSVNFDEAPFMFLFWSMMGIVHNEKMRDCVDNYCLNTNEGRV